MPANTILFLTLFLTLGCCKPEEENLPPTPLDNPRGLALSPTEIKLMWGALQPWDFDRGSVPGFEIEREGEIVDVLGSNATAWYDDTLSPGETQTYRVSKYDQGGSNWSMDIVLTTPMPLAMGWASTAIDVTSEPEDSFIEEVALAASPDGELHAAFPMGHSTYEDGIVLDELVYAVRHDGLWSRETVPVEPTAHGTLVSLALDGQGRPHLLFMGHVQTSYGMQDRLVHAVLDGEDWTWETIEPALFAGCSIQGTAIVIDTDDGLHAVVGAALCAGSLGYLWSDGGDWTAEWVLEASEGGVWSDDIALALNDEQRPCVVASHIFTPPDKDTRLELICRGDGGDWHGQIITQDSDHSADLVFDGDGIPHVSYAVPDPPHVAYATQVNGYWQEQWIAEDNPPYTAVTLDDQGRVFVGYREQLSWRDEYGTWHHTTLDDVGEIGERVEAVTDARGEVHMLHTEDDSFTVNLVTALPEPPTPMVEMLVDGYGDDLLPSIDMHLDDAGQVHVAWVVDEVIKGTRGETWESVGVGALGGAGPLAVTADSLGRPAIVTGHEWLEVWEERIGAWWPATSGEGATEKPECIGAFGPDDDLHVVCATSMGVRYIHPDLGEWPDVQLERTADTLGLSLVIDPEGKLFVSFLDLVDRSVKVAEGSGASWDVSTVAYLPEVGYRTSIALDSSGEPHVSYAEATSDGPADGIWPLRLMVASREQGTWDVEVADSAAYCGGWSALAIDDDDEPAILHVDAAQGTIRFTTRDLDGWRSTVLTPVSHDVGIGMALEAGDDAWHALYLLDNVGGSSLNLMYSRIPR
ncbi:MAG: hypothetical protein HN396_16180 [Gemmatimonadales bacterium]|nr:hypothetical protein [Gemmatimonadales bacterium]